MSFQAYLDNIKAKTGKSPEDFKKLAGKKGLISGGALKPGVKVGDIIAWLKKDFELGRGHAMAIYAAVTSSKKPKLNIEESITKYFSGGKAAWREVFDSLMYKLKEYGNDIQIAPTDTYLSILRDGKKFAIVQATTGRLDIGIKLKNVKPTARFKPAGTWNAMVTHRVQIDNPKQLDKELLKWMLDAYEQNEKRK